MKDTQPVLIISTGRTGTIFFSRLFADLYPTEAASYHERGASRPIQILTNLHFARLLPKSALTAAWKVLKGSEIAACGKPFHIDANCFLYGLAALAPELYPNVKIIHIVRDPRDYVTSHLNFSRQKETSFIANYFVPFWQPNPFLVGEIPWTRAMGFSRFERYCWVWDFKNRLMSSLEGTGTAYLRVRFEDVFDAPDPAEPFNAITDFIGLPRAKGIADYFRTRVNQAGRNAFPDWTDWPPRRCAQLQEVCGKQMARYGYGGEPAWIEKLAAASPNQPKSPA
ncbi:MAG: sulfotransferase domain-containing protein [Chloroflexota bacterium]